MDLFSPTAWFAFVQVLAINIVLSADNVVVIGMVAGRVRAADRSRVITWGMGVAIALRLVLALIAVDLLKILGLTFAGGILLLWVTWRMYRDTIAGSEGEAESDSGQSHSQSGHVPFGRAIAQVAIADVSMSVDNALAVAGAANQNLPVLVVGLVLSVAIMAVAANYVAKLLQRHPYLAYIGVLLVLYISLEMIWRGSGELPAILKRIG